jgi:hypothetical protein
VSERNPSWVYFEGSAPILRVKDMESQPAVLRESVGIHKR